MEALKIAAQLFEMIAGRHPQVLIRRCIIEHLDLAEEPFFQTGRNLLRSDVLDEEIAKPVVPKAHDHVQPSLSACTTHWDKTAISSVLLRCEGSGAPGPEMG